VIKLYGTGLEGQNFFVRNSVAVLGANMILIIFVGSVLEVM
jgi:hypothetical protein